MTTERIYTKSATYQKFEVLKNNRNKRYKYKELFVEGVRNINEAIKNDWAIVSFLYTTEKTLSDWAKDIIKSTKTEINYELPLNLMAELSGKEDTSELIALINMRDDNISQFKLSDNPLLALFDRPSNKGNLGSVIRSCDALGIDGLIITGHAVDLYDPDTVVSTMGSFFKLPVIRMVGNESVQSFISDMKNDYPGFKVIGTTSHHETNIYDVDMTTPILIMIGNETDGLCNQFKEICDVEATIPMDVNSSASSFNVACASTVIFYEAVRQRKKILR